MSAQSIRSFSACSVLSVGLSRAGVMIWFLGLCLYVMVPTIQCEKVSDSNIMRLNYGVTFKRIDTIDIVTDVWWQAFVIKLPVINASMLNVEHVDCSHFGDSTGCSHMIDLIRFLYNVSGKSMRQIDSAIQHIHRLLPELSRGDGDRTDGRAPRGLFDFFGEIQHGLFGLARDSDVLGVRKTVAELARREHAMASAWSQAEGRLASFGAVVNHRLDNMKEMVSTQKQAIHELYQSVAADMSASARASSLLARAFGRAEDFVILLNSLNELQNGLELLSHGLLSPSVVSPGDIHRALSAIDASLRQMPGVELRILRPRVRSYYKMHNYIITRDGNNIVLHLAIPLGVLPTPLYLYKIQTFPLMIPNSAEHATILTDIPRFLAFHPESSYFLEFDALPTVSPTKLLFLEEAHDAVSAAFQVAAQPSCALLILRNEVNNVPRRCHFAVVTHAVKPQVLSLDRHHILLTSISHARIRCQNGSEHNVSCEATCRVTLPCRCGLVSGSIFVPGRQEGCLDMHRKPVVLHNVNLAVLQHFFAESQLSEIYGNSLLENPMNVIIPKLKMFEADFSDELERDKQARFDLAKIVNLTRNDQTAYASLAHSMVNDWSSYASGEFEQNFSLFSWKSWGLVLIGVLSVLSFGMAVLLTYKLKLLAASVTAMSLVPRVHSIPSELIYVSSTVTPANQTNIFQFVSVPVDLTLDVTVILLLIVIVLVVLIKGFKRRQQSRYQFDLVMQIGCGNSGCEVWIKSLQLEPDFYRFSASNFVQSLQVDGCLWPRLLIRWTTLDIFSSITNEHYTLPMSVRLNWRQASFLRKVLRKSFWCVLVSKGPNGSSLVSVTPFPNSGPDLPTTGHIKFSDLKPNASAPALYPMEDLAQFT